MSRPTPLSHGIAHRLRVSEWRPRAQVRTRATRVHRPAFPVVDVHNHLGRWLSEDGGWLVADVPALVRLMDTLGIASIVNLDGRWGNELAENIARYDAAHPGRFLTFCQVNWDRLALDGTNAVAALERQLADSATAGAGGVKVWKDLGLRVRDASGRLVAPDDERVIAVLRAAGDLGLPVLIHTADPVAFFDPLDGTNERVDELTRQPDWWFGDAGPSFANLMAALDRLIGACPSTTFIGAHVGCWAEDLDQVGQMLARHSNWNVDLAGRLGEIGRQPRTFRRLVETFPDRVLFGSDAYPPSPDPYLRYFRFLETEDDHFDYTEEEIPPQGRWAIYGCQLDEQYLEAVYAGNARRLLSFRGAG